MTTVTTSRIRFNQMIPFPGHPNGSENYILDLSLIPVHFSLDLGSETNAYPFSIYVESKSIQEVFL